MKYFHENNINISIYRYLYTHVDYLIRYQFTRVNFKPHTRLTEQSSTLPKVLIPPILICVENKNIQGKMFFMKFWIAENPLNVGKTFHENVRFREIKIYFS